MIIFRLHRSYSTQSSVGLQIVVIDAHFAHLHFEFQNILNNKKSKLNETVTLN